MRTESFALNQFLDEINDNHGMKLKDIALTTIRSKLLGMRYRPRIRDSILKEKAGVFVTLEKNGELRGCVGYVYPTYEMWEATRMAASQAAFSDPRFKSIHRSELEDLEIEISVLGSLEKMKVSTDKDISSLRIGTEGLMIVGFGSSGLLLPQVATEMDLSPVEFLEATCEKAGLSSDSWNKRGVSVYKFPARIF